MLILILINVKYFQIVVFSFEKGLNHQKQYSPDFYQPIKQFPPQQNFLFLPLQYPLLKVISNFFIAPLSVKLLEKPWTNFKWEV